MPDERQQESADLRDYQVLDGSDTLDDGPGSDPLDRGVVPPSRWTTALRTGATAQEQQDGESLDQLLDQEVPDAEVDDDDDDAAAGNSWDEGATDQEIARLERNDDADPRAGRLVASDDGDYAGPNPDLVASDAGTDGGGATAEEAALHVVSEDDEFGPEVP